MADDPKGIYFAPNNQGFATILPDRRDPNVFDYMERGMMQRAAQRRQGEEQRQKDLEKVKGFDTYRYYLPATTEMTNDLIGFVSQEGYNPAEFQRRVALYTQLSQAQMQMKDFDEITFKEYDDDARITDAAKEAYIGKFRKDSSMQGLMQAAKETPDKTWFTKEVGGSEFMNEPEVMKTAFDNKVIDWIQNSEEGEAFAVKYFGRSLRGISSENVKMKMRSIARFDEATGQFIVKNPDQLIQDGFLMAFQGDQFANRIIEDRAIERHKSQGLEGPVEDQTRAEVLAEMLNPYAKAGEMEQGTKMQIGRDYYNPGDEANAALAQRLYKKVESLIDMDKKAPYSGEVKDPVFKGYEFGDYKLGDVVQDGTETYIEFQEKVVDEYGITKWEPRKDVFTIDWIYKTLPQSVASKFEKIAFDKGRITETGDFRSKANKSGYTDEELQSKLGTKAPVKKKPITLSDIFNK